MTKAELNKILEEHKLWLDTDGKKGLRANLSGANLYGANLFRATLSEANLSGANLSEANLYGADLSGADLSGADLYWADLSWADLSKARLYKANLSEAGLIGANLREANLTEANLTRAVGVVSGQFGRHLAYAWLRKGEVVITIGCEEHTRTHWLKHYKEIGKRHGYTPEQIKAYYYFIKYGTLAL